MVQKPGNLNNNKARNGVVHRHNFHDFLPRLLFLRPDAGVMAVVTSKGAGGIMASRMAIAVITIPPLLGWLILQESRADKSAIAFYLNLDKLIIGSW